MPSRAHMELSFKERCVALRTEGHSIIEIMRVTGRPKTSVYHHIQYIPLSARRRDEIRKQAGARIRVFAVARKGKSARSFRTFSAWTPKIVLLVSHLLFDGELMRGKCNYHNRSTALLMRVEQLMRILYDFEPKRTVDRITGVQRLVYHNVALGNFLYEKGQELISEVSEYPRAFKREFLRAFFDDEGCMTVVIPRKRQVRGYQKNTKILKLIQKLLSDFSIQSDIRPPNEVVISGKENLLRFQKEINFSLGVRINGNRSNSIWKKHLEKRELLERAIKSFKT